LAGDKTIGRGQRRSAPLQVVPPPGSPGTKFLVIPVEPGIFSIVPDKCRSGRENGEANQALAGQFPWRAKREFIRA